jgi:ribonuclease BN (tRNA processing enzyme)
VYAPPNALDAVLALDSPHMLAGGFRLRDLDIGGEFEIGPFRCETRLLPHWLPNAGLRLAAGSLSLAYTGDSGPSPEVVALARDADLLIADATFPGAVPEDSLGYVTSASQAAQQAADAGSGRLLLTHLWPGTDHAAAIGAASDAYAGQIAVAVPGVSLDIG